MKTYTPHDKRPDNKPYYISSTCKLCNAKLVLDSLFQDPSTPEDEIWWDAWICPCCQDGVHLDWPQERNYDLNNKIRDTENLEDLDAITIPNLTSKF